ncbi:hypothetical protein ACLOJK_029327 [Asimina triloba]
MPGSGALIKQVRSAPATDELEIVVKSHLRLGNSVLMFNDFVALQELLRVGGWPSIFFDRDGDVVDDDEATVKLDLLEAFKVFGTPCPVHHRSTGIRCSTISTNDGSHGCCPVIFHGGGHRPIEPHQNDSNDKATANPSNPHVDEHDNSTHNGGILALAGKRCMPLLRSAAIGVVLGFL